MNQSERLCSVIYPQIYKYFFRNCHQLTEVATPFVLKYPKPNIPLRIKRGPTDILKALSETVNRDLTAPAYKFHDDPYLYPLLSTEKRSYALSKESGKKAARWVRDKHGEFFNHQPDDPVIECLLPRTTFDENSEVTENDLLKSIQDFQVSEAIQVYSICKSKNIELSLETRQALLELLCFYNCQDGIDPEWLEEISHQSFMVMDIHKTWKNGSQAEELFDELKEAGNFPYCAIIKGMCKYNEVNQAWALYQEALGKGFSLDTETFNGLIRITPALDIEHSRCWEKAEELLHKMVELRHVPNICTMNSLLLCIFQLKNLKRELKKQTALSVLSEFHQLGIQPCLASYYYILLIFGRMESGSVLASILDDLESRTLTIEAPQDTMFPFFAMELCMKNNLGLHLAERLNSFLQKGNNLNFLGENMKMARYFQSYLSVAVSSLPLQEFIAEIYERLVPHVYTPVKEVFEEIIQNIGVHNQLNYLPRIWADCVLYKRDEEKVMAMILMVISKHPWQDDDPSLSLQLGDITWDIWTNFEEKRKTRIPTIEWKETMIDDLLFSLVKSHNLNKAITVFSTLCEDPSLVIGVLHLETLNLLFAATFEQKFLKEAKMVVKYTKENGYPEADAMMEKLDDKVIKA